MKVFESKEEYMQERSYILELLDNDLPLVVKMLRLKNSLSDIKLNYQRERELLSTLLTKLGGEIYFPRKGDNSERFDALITFDKYKAVVEIEIPSTEILDAPRNLLDDYAVLMSRGNIGELEVVPLVICWDLPNKRTDYWNVISDIDSVLNIKIKTVSVLCLALYYWTDTFINFASDDFFLRYNNLTILQAERILKEHNLSPKMFPGCFSPFK